MSLGILYGISVGTGEPELITVKGLRLLQKCPVVAFPVGVNNQPGIAETIISTWLKPEQKTLSLDFPYVANQGILKQAWNQAAEKVWLHIQKGQDVAFACEGDISFYSTFNYLAKTLKQQHPEIVIERIPGVSSPMAAACALQLPLTVQNQSLVILPALYQVEALESALEWADEVVLLKVKSVYSQVYSLLKQKNLLETAACLERVSTQQQKIYYPLTDYPDLELSYFSLLIIYTNVNKF